MTRHAPTATHAQVTNYQPLERFLLRAGRNQNDGGCGAVEAKIYFLIVLIGVIAAASRRKGEPESPKQTQ
jgi:hypothetical protein